MAYNGFNSEPTYRHGTRPCRLGKEYRRGRRRLIPLVYTDFRVPRRVLYSPAGLEALGLVTVYRLGCRYERMAFTQMEPVEVTAVEGGICRVRVIIHWIPTSDRPDGQREEIINFCNCDFIK